MNILDLSSQDKSLEVPFVVTIGYNPSIAQINMKGKAMIKGEDEELDEIVEKYEENEQPPQFLVQTIINRSIMEATLISRSLNVPPPIPFLKPDQENKDLGPGDRDYVG